jgi:hypothetical protein
MLIAGVRVISETNSISFVEKWPNYLGGYQQFHKDDHQKLHFKVEKCAIRPLGRT